MTNFRVTSWNTAKRLKQINFQIEFIDEHDSDVTALQEVIPSTETIFRDRLKDKYPYQMSSFELAPDLSLLKKKRMFGQLILSKFPIRPLDPNRIAVPGKREFFHVLLLLVIIRLCFTPHTFPQAVQMGG